MAILSLGESALLVDVLKEYHAELHSEIHCTDDFGFERNLQDEERRLKRNRLQV